MNQKRCASVGYRYASSACRHKPRSFRPDKRCRQVAANPRAGCPDYAMVRSSRAALGLSFPVERSPREEDIIFFLSSFYHFLYFERKDIKKVREKHNFLE